MSDTKELLRRWAEAADFPAGWSPAERSTLRQSFFLHLAPDAENDARQLVASLSWHAAQVQQQVERRWDDDGVGRLAPYTFKEFRDEYGSEAIERWFAAVPYTSG